MSLTVTVERPESRPALVQVTEELASLPRQMPEGFSVRAGQWGYSPAWVGRVGNVEYATWRDGSGWRVTACHRAFEDYVEVDIHGWRVTDDPAETLPELVRAVAARAGVMVP